MRSHAAVALLALALAAPARPQAPPEPAGAARARPAGVEVDWTRDGLLTGGALVLAAVGEVASSSLAPSSCRWCQPPGFDTSVRDALVWSRPGTASTLSDVLLVTLPAGVAVYEWLNIQEARSVAADLLVLAEAMALTGVATELSKLAVARQRPYAWAGGGSGAADERLSFWSGHAALAFSAAAAGGRIAQQRGDAAWPWVYAAGFTAAAGTSYLRLAADKHWLSDAVVGAAVGTAFGLVVPWLHRPGRDRSLQVALLPRGIAIAGRF